MNKKIKEKIPSRIYSQDDKNNLISIWENIISVQKHFNDIEIRIRNCAVTLYTFILGGIGYTIKENVRVSINEKSISLAAIIGIFGIVPMIAFYIMDRHWYHRLLNASVEQGIKIEKELEEIYPNISLSTAIKEKSPTSFLFTNFKIHSGGKLNIFYFLLTFSFLIISWMIYKFNI
jgi:hypothetical protein